MKIANTAQLIELNNTALRLDYNRCMEADWVTATVDPDGLHIISSVMVHEHAQGQAVDPHLRCMTWIKLKGQDDPYEGFLDVQFADYEKLPGAIEHTELSKDFVSKWNSTL